MAVLATIIGPVSSYLDIDFGGYVFLTEALDHYGPNQIQLERTM